MKENFSSWTGDEGGESFLEDFSGIYTQFLFCDVIFWLPRLGPSEEINPKPSKLLETRASVMIVEDVRTQKDLILDLNNY